MRGLPLLWWSFVEPVCWNLLHNLEMVLWLTFRVRPFIRFCLTVDLSMNQEIHVRKRYRNFGAIHGIFIFQRRCAHVAESQI